MARTADLDKLPSTRNVSDNDRQIVMGALAKLFPVMRDLLDRDENMPEMFNANDLSQVRDLANRVFVFVASDVNARRKSRLSTLRDLVIGNEIVAMAMKAETAKRDMYAGFTPEQRALLKIDVPTKAKIDYGTVKLAVSAAFPGITDTDLHKDLEKVGLAVEGTEKRGHVVQIPFDVFAERSAILAKRAADLAAETAKTETAKSPAEKPSKGSAKDAAASNG